MNFLDNIIERSIFYLLLSSSLYKANGHVCPQHSCNWMSSVERPFPLCYCDTLCHVYKDCCKDTEDISKETNQSETSVDLLDFDDRHCLSLPQTFGRYGFRVVDNCNGKRCSSDPLSIQMILPVTVTSTGTTFLNAECAKCNGQSDFRFWDVIFSPNNRDALDVLRDKNSSNEDIIQSFLISKPNEYDLILQLDDITVPRFCVNLQDVEPACPKYLSPISCGHGSSHKRNIQCALTSSPNCKVRCIHPVNPFVQFISKKTYMSVLLKFREDVSLSGSGNYLMEIRNPAVTIVISVSVDSILSWNVLNHFLGAVYISLQHHSGYDFKPFAFLFRYKINTRNCTSFALCFKYIFHFNVKLEISVDRIFIQDFLNKNITLVYEDKNLEFCINQSKLTIQSSVDFHGLTKFWFRRYSSSMGDFKSLSEMRNCKVLSICASFNDSYAQADVETMCTRRISDTTGLASKNTKKCVLTVLAAVMITIKDFFL